MHNCTWSFYMEDLISKHSESQDNCAAKLLEAKRSLDGLLHSVRGACDLYVSSDLARGSILLNLFGVHLFRPQPDSRSLILCLGVLRI